MAIFRIITSFFFAFCFVFGSYAEDRCAKRVRMLSEMLPIPEPLLRAGISHLRTASETVARTAENPSEYNKISKDPKTRNFFKLSEIYEEIREGFNQIEDFADLVRDAQNDATFQAEAEEAIQTIKSSTREKALEAMSLIRAGNIPDINEIVVKVRFPNVQKNNYAEKSALGRKFFEMYQKYAKRMGWTLDVIETDESSVGLVGLTFRVTGARAGNGFQHEAGEHKIELVADGKVHTNFILVNVFFPSESDIQIYPDSDFEINAVRSQGPGGQNVNKVSTAAVVTHKPTGRFLKVQVTRSLTQNSAIGKSLLRTVLAAEKRASELSAKRDQVIAQTGIHPNSTHWVRNYDFTRGEGSVFDYRTAQTYSLDSVVNRGELGPVVEGLELRQLENILSVSTGRP